MWKKLCSWLFGDASPRPAPIQKDIGRIVATIHLKSGDNIVGEFVGKNKGFSKFYGGEWIPFTTHATYVYNDWLDNLQFIKDHDIDIPVTEIISITKEHFENIVTVE